jgi:hypothetical protein
MSQVSARRTPKPTLTKVFKWLDCHQRPLLPLFSLLAHYYAYLEVSTP